MVVPLYIVQNEPLIEMVDTCLAMASGHLALGWLIIK